MFSQTSNPIVGSEPQGRDETARDCFWCLFFFFFLFFLFSFSFSVWPGREVKGGAEGGGGSGRRAQPCVF